MKARYLFLSLLAATALPISAADAAVLLIFGQTSAGDTVTGTRSGTSTTITSDTQVQIDEIDATVVTPTLATFTLSATNSGLATPVGSGVLQHYSGTFSITSGATNYLSGTFSDAVFGSGGALTLSASNPSPTQSVSFTSNVIAPSLISAFNRAASLSFTDVTPPAGITLGTLRGFSSDVSGDFSSTVPEPSTWAMMPPRFRGAWLRRASQGPRPIGNLDRLIGIVIQKAAFGRPFPLFPRLENIDEFAGRAIDSKTLVTGRAPRLIPPGRGGVFWPRSHPSPRISPHFRV